MAGLIDRMVGEQAQRISKQIDDKMSVFEKDITTRLERIDSRLDKIERLIKDVQAFVRR